MKEFIVETDLDLSCVIEFTGAGDISFKPHGELIRCKDCKHRPTGTNRDDLEFPDNKCPCQCDDFWYSWKPSDDWFCGNGERKDGERQWKN